MWWEKAKKMLTMLSIKYANSSYYLQSGCFCIFPTAKPVTWQSGNFHFNHFLTLRLSIDCQTFCNLKKREKKSFTTKCKKISKKWNLHSPRIDKFWPWLPASKFWNYKHVFTHPQISWVSCHSWSKCLGVSIWIINFVISRWR